MLWGIFRFELRYQLRRFWPWLAFAAVFAIIFMSAKSAPVDDATYANTWINSSFTVAMNTVVGCLVWLLVAAPVAGEAAARDAATLMHPLAYTTPVSKRDYLGGRFLAALALNLLILLSVTAALLVASYMPGVPSQFIGPFRPMAFLGPFLILALPNAFLVTAVQFAIASLSRRPMAAYLGSILVFFSSYAFALIVYFVLKNQETAKIFDPVGPFLIFGTLPEGWTAIEKNQRLLGFEGIIARNRLLWMTVGVLICALTLWRFRFEHYVPRSLWKWLFRRKAVLRTEPEAVIAAPESLSPKPQTAATSFSPEAQLLQAFAISRVSFGKLVRMRGGLDILLFISALIVLIMPINLEVAGNPILPTAERIAKDLVQPLTNFATPFVLIPLLIVYWAGELVWRERDAGLGEITDASPIPHWAMFAGKLDGLFLMLAAYTVLLTIAGTLVQVIKGADPQPLRLLQFFSFQFVDYALFATLAFVIHILANQKYLGHLLAVMAFGLICISGLIGVEHRMIIFGASPSWSFTQMRGFGASLAPWAWFKLYWAAWALLLSFAGVMLWSRGREGTMRMRLHLARQRLTPAMKRFGSVAAVALLASGSFVFWNTNLRHRYYTSDEDNRVRAEYEQRYAKYQRAPQPTVVNTSLRVELYPERRTAEVRGQYVLLNEDSVAIDTVFLAPSGDVKTTAVTFDRATTLVSADSAHLTHVYRLAQPLQPGDSMRMTFDVRFAPRGFTNGGASVAVLHNGTQIKLSDWLPGIGYQPSREILKPRDRIEYGLPARPIFPVVEDEAARYEHKGERTMFDAIIGTSPEETAVAPGALQREWTENGRRYFHYRTDAPIGGEKPVLSAEYAVLEETWNPGDGRKPVKIRINYHPAHRRIVDHVLRGARATLEYGTKHFGPYPYGHVTISERSAGGMGLNAESGNIDYSEQFATLAPWKNPNVFDFPVAVLGHEMGHNFGVPIASVEGAPIMSESFAWYTAMGVMEEAYGKDALVRMLAWMHEPYPHKPIKTGAPLIRALDPWSGYRRGPFAHYALKEYLGEARVNGAIRTLREKKFAKGATPATTLDLYRELDAVTPDSLKWLLHDLFAANTFWELGVVGSAKPGQGTSWDVTLEITARKVVVDSAGKETEVPMNDLVDVGVFGSRNQRVPTDPLYFEKRRITSGKQTITLTVPRKPERVGLDPYLLLLDLDANDNWEAIQIRQ